MKIDLLMKKRIFTTTKYTRYMVVRCLKKLIIYEFIHNFWWSTAQAWSCIPSLCPWYYATQICIIPRLWQSSVQGCHKVVATWWLMLVIEGRGSDILYYLMLMVLYYVFVCRVLKPWLDFTWEQSHRQKTWQSTMSIVPLSKFYTW